MANAVTKSPTFRVFVTRKDGNLTDVSDFVLRISVTKSLGSFVGKFNLIMRNRIDFVLLTTKTGTLKFDEFEEFFKPMTYIQIQMKSNPGKPFVTVMRGFVDSVGGREAVSDTGGEDRTVINGSDMGKIFVKQRVFFRPELSRIIASSQQKTPFFEGAAENAAAIRVRDFASAQFSLPFYNQEFTPNQFMHEILNALVHPYVENVLSGYNIERMGESLSGSFLIDNGIEIRPVKLFLNNLTTHSGALLNILNFAKNSPWGELFLVEGEDRTIFVYRATPWRVPVGGGREKEIPLMKIRKRGISLADSPTVGEGSQSIDAQQEVEVTNVKDFLSDEYNNVYFNEAQEILGNEVRITLDEIKSREIFRDDSDVFTYFVTYPYDHIVYKISALNQGFQDLTASSNPFLLRGHTDFYGFRPLEVKSTFYPMVLNTKSPDVITSSGGTAAKTPAEQLRNIRPFAKQYLDDFNKAMTDAYRYNPDYEKGRIVISGNENIRIGQYIKMEVVNGLDATFYVESVNHEFTAFGDFLTNLRVSRGTAAINNGNSIVNESLNDIDDKAIADDIDRIYESFNTKASTKATDSKEMNSKYKPSGR